MRQKLKLLLLLAMLMPVWLQSLYAETITVCGDASTACNMAPIYGSYFNVVGTESQMVYPGAMLADIPVGSKITSITFYCRVSGQTGVDANVPDYQAAQISVNVGETPLLTINSLADMTANRGAATTVYSGTVPRQGSQMTINFSTPYQYMGQNLLIDFYLAQAGDYNAAYWRAKAVSAGDAVYSTGGSFAKAKGLDGEAILPEMTITYEKPEWSAIATPASGATIDFGRVYVGTTSSQTITVTNQGTQAITPGVMVLNNADNLFSATAGTTIATGEQTPVALTFSPQAVGDFSAMLNVTAYDGKVFNYTLTGQGTDDPALSVAFAPQVLDFGMVDAGTQLTGQLTITNHGTDDIDGAALHVEGKHSPFNVPASVTIPAGSSTTVEVTFAPQDASSFNQCLWFEANGCTYETYLRGIGKKDGAKAIRDRAFFEGKTYTWKVNNEGAVQTSNLAEVATDPDQMIALMRKVYTDTDIPGNWHRGYTEANALENYSVEYAGVGTITDSGQFADSYGWGITGTVTGSGNIKRLDPNEYKPKYDGVTLLLVEVKDGTQLTEEDTHHVSSPSSYAELREYFARWFKSVRVVTESMMVGQEGALNEGTLFKVDCNQMNRFFFLAKGRLRSFTRTLNNNVIEGAFYTERTKYYDVLNYGPFYHMFEQLSAYDLIGDQNATDIYQELVAMKTYKVEHDCISISKPYSQWAAQGEHATFSHEFNMYGRESVSDDCQDVRDLMFLVPTHRMTAWTATVDGTEVGRDKTKQGGTGIFVNYHNTYAPLMGLFSIIQDPIVGERLTDIEHMYQLTLQWRSNLMDFVPEGGKYQLYQVINQNGVESYVPVYRQYIENGEVVTTTEPVYVDARYLSTDEEHPETYTPIYIPMQEHGQQVTFAIRAQDAEEFLTLQMSNKRSYIIPGYNLAEKLELHIGDDYTSRFDPQNERNCYSNQVIVNGYTASIAKAFLSTDMQDQFAIVRTSRTPQEDASGNVIVDGNGNIVYDEQSEIIARATVTELPAGNGNGTLRIDIIDATQTAADMFPKAKDGNTAGYHQNPSSSLTVNFVVKQETETSERYVYFWNNDTEQRPTFAFYDNFLAETATNAHPTEYVYQAFLTTAHPFKVSETDPTVTSTNAQSNTATVYIHKTNMDMAGVFSLRKVELDGSPEHGGKRYLLPNAAEFSIDVKFSPKSEVLRYDAYRWPVDDTRYIIESVNDGEEEDVMPTGSADNNVDTYTIKMDGVPQAEVSVPSDGRAVAAPFRDDYVMANGGDFIYAPVVETFSGDIKTYNYYNTYGAPLKKAVAAPIEVKVAHDVNTTACPLMSDFHWQDGNDIYAYYNIPLEFTKLEVPAGYEIYKVRAWRLTDDVDVLGEQTGSKVPDRSSRLSKDYLFEDMNYGTVISDDALTLQKSSLMPGQNAYALGSRLVSGGMRDETTATFGAKRLRGIKDNTGFSEGSVDVLDFDFVVRIYFTPVANPAVVPAGDSNQAPRQATGAQPKDFDYYVSEATVHYSIKSTDEVVTSVSSPVENLGREVVTVTYVNPMGQVSNRPFSGINIIVTRYSDGTTSTHKAIR